MSDERSTSESSEEMSEEALDNVTGGIIIVGGSFLLPALQRNWASQMIPTDPIRKAQPGDPR